MSNKKNTQTIDDDDDSETHVETTPTSLSSPTPTFLTIIDSLMKYYPDIPEGMNPDEDFIKIEDLFIAKIQNQSEKIIKNFHQNLLDLIKYLPPLNSVGTYAPNGPIIIKGCTQHDVCDGNCQCIGRGNKLNLNSYTNSQVSTFISSCLVLMDPISTQEDAKLIYGYHLPFVPTLLEEIPDYMSPIQNDLDQCIVAQNLAPIDTYFTLSGSFSLKAFVQDLKAME